MIKLLTTLTTYIIIILAELGDKTQVATLIFASNNPSRRWQVYSASALALVACVVIEVTIGATLARHISPALINRIAGVVFLGVGLVSLVGVLCRSASATKAGETRGDALARESPKVSESAVTSPASSGLCSEETAVNAAPSARDPNPSQP